MVRAAGLLRLKAADAATGTRADALPLLTVAATFGNPLAANQWRPLIPVMESTLDQADSATKEARKINPKAAIPNEAKLKYEAVDAAVKATKKRVPFGMEADRIKKIEKRVSNAL